MNSPDSQPGDATEIEVSLLDDAVDEPAKVDNSDIIRRHVVLATGAGMIPIPLADLAAVTAIQMDALKQIASAHGMSWENDNGKRFVAALTGSAFARLGASALKAIPIVGSVLGGVTMSVMAGASTWAICNVADSHFARGENFVDANMDRARSAYEAALEKGKEFVQNMKEDDKATADAAQQAYEEVARLTQLRESGELSQQEFERLREEVLQRLS